MNDFRYPIETLVGKTFGKVVVTRFLYVGRDGLNYYECLNWDTKEVEIFNQKILEGDDFSPITEIENAMSTFIERNLIV